ncbi:MAG: hypothetical protein HQL86_06485 [Magnetococcales bacterium]|nr:hypothetical protein [Magnetococcales bacterium]
MTLDLTPFKSLIKNGCGLIFEGGNEAILACVVNERLASLKLSPGGYLDRLRQGGLEFRELINRLTINETFFFREPEQIQFLVDRLVPRFLSSRQNFYPPRILSMGCSSGEEIYSVVMALIARYGEVGRSLFRFAGCDIDSVILAKARRGCYSEFSFRGVESHWRETFFTKEGPLHCLHEPIKRAVTFHEFNVVNDPIPGALQGIDILLFRNVSIYFDTSTRLSVLQRLTSMLNENGVLIVAASETLANNLGVLHLVEEDGFFYFTRSDSQPTTSQPPPLLPLHRDAPPSKPDILTVLEVARPQPEKASSNHAASGKEIPGEIAPLEIDQLRRLVDEKQLDQASLSIESVLSRDPGHPGAALLKAHLLIERRAFAEAESMVRMVLTRDPEFIDALFLLGVAAKWQKKPDEAIQWFKQTVYRAHHCWPAHYHLAELHRFGNEIERARHGYRVVLQLLSNGGLENGLRVVPSGLPLAEIRFLCTHQLERMQTARPFSGVTASHGP